MEVLLHVKCRYPRVYELKNPRVMTVNLMFTTDNLGFMNANPGFTNANPGFTNANNPGLTIVNLRLTDLMCKST